MTTTASTIAQHTTGADAAHDRRITVALFAAGLTTFASMYNAQALLPSLSAAFGATPARAALAVSLTTGCLALAIVPVSALSSRIGRTRVMIGSAAAAAVIGLLIPFSPSLDALLAGRAVQGIALAGVPAVAMAYLAEEIGGEGLGAAMGVYVAGTTIGGLAGRLIPSFTLDVASWRWAAAAVGVAAAACTVWFVRLLPPSRGFVARPAGVRTVLGDLGQQLRHRQLLALFGLAFVLMGGFVSIYNFLGYRLTQHPFELPAAVAGSVFLLYLAGTVTSAWGGRLADRVGRQRMLTASMAVMGVGLALSLPDRLGCVVAGVLLYTAGFFAAHTVASAWVGTLARGNRGAASSLYLFFYYLGSAVVGGLSGLAFAHAGWAGLVGAVGALLAAGAILFAVATIRPGDVVRSS
ncbi:MFS transporter [Nocardia bhagyanarayanae]|uniref:Putative MFS family arabinose efflux permease n=1 Tax=Nocardia bhagyanarayanae TaxID=1215925 RepID=A0A543EVT5_9NOCA|nr:MFS transporter [Nocardia bhagyanarayanae]TQM25690.1 putative MFS family arabinose efflux permease [Nocardia bhagyanarayanae]